MVGASAGISGMMGAATRFAFQPGGSLDMWRARPHDADRVPAAPLLPHCAIRASLAFVGVWFGLNLLFGLGSLSIAGGDQSVAWEAHVGGFLAGLLLFSLFDPVAPQRRSREDRADYRLIVCQLLRLTALRMAGSLSAGSRTGTLYRTWRLNS